MSFSAINRINCGNDTIQLYLKHYSHDWSFQLQRTRNSTSISNHLFRIEILIND